MDRILITGASGLIGHEVVRALQGQCSIYAISRRPNEQLSQNTRMIRCDLAEECDFSPFPERVDAVIHLAQSEHFREFPEKAENIFSVNTLSTLRLLEYARRAGAKTFVYASSGGIYGYGDEGFRENQPIVAQRDLGFYQDTKLCSEIIAENYVPYLNIVILRFFFVYGPRQNATMLIPRLIRNVREGNPILLQGNNGIRINPTHVSDAAEAVIRSLNLMDSQKINVGGPEVLTLRQIGEVIGECLGKQPVFEIQEDVQPHNLVGDTHKMTRLLAPPRVKFAEGIRSML